MAHGTEANRLAQLLLKTEVPLLWRRRYPVAVLATVVVAAALQLELGGGLGQPFFAGSAFVAPATLGHASC